MGGYTNGMWVLMLNIILTDILPALLGLFAFGLLVGLLNWLLMVPP